MPLEILTIEYLDKCNLSCAHCAVNASPSGDNKLSLEDAFSCILAARDHGVKCISLAGGEPFLVFEELCNIAQYSNSLGLKFNTFTNAFWAKDLAETKKFLEPLYSKGLSSLHLSLDCFHLEEGIGIQNLINIAKVAKKLGLKLTINVLQVEQGKISYSYVKKLFKGYDIIFEYESVMPMGRAAKLRNRLIKDNLKNYSSGCRSFGSPIISPKGDVFACDGAYLLAGQGNPLKIGNIHETPVKQIFSKFCGLTLVNFIATFGPSSICEFVNPQNIPVYGDSKHTCDFCNRILNIKENSDAIIEKFKLPDSALKIKLELTEICSKNVYSLRTQESPWDWKIKKFCRAKLPTFLSIWRFARTTAGKLSPRTIKD
ncbi:MAG: radical SAM protein [Candidatus Omnitrophica bacterium]|nr:radical SAM protein [Candidatus Omnitrophota bacterium]